MTHRTALASLAVATLLLAGCSDGGEDPQGDPGSSSSTPSGSASSEPADPESTEATEPAVEPATGLLIDRDRISMRVPEGWKKTRQIATFLEGAQDPTSFSAVSLGDLSAVGEPTLEEQAAFAAKNEKQTRILEPVEIAGVDWYHVVGREDQYVVFEQFGTVSHGSQATINFSLDDELSPDERRAIVASVLATVEWK